MSKISISIIFLIIGMILITFSSVFAADVTELDEEQFGEVGSLFNRAPACHIYGDVYAQAALDSEQVVLTTFSINSSTGIIIEIDSYDLPDGTDADSIAMLSHPDNENMIFIMWFDGNVGTPGTRIQSWDITNGGTIPAAATDSIFDTANDQTQNQAIWAGDSYSDCISVVGKNGDVTTVDNSYVWTFTMSTTGTLASVDRLSLGNYADDYAYPTHCEVEANKYYAQWFYLASFLSSRIYTISAVDGTISLPGATWSTSSPGFMNYAGNHFCASVSEDIVVRVSSDNAYDLWYVTMDVSGVTPSMGTPYEIDTARWFFPSIYVLDNNTYLIVAEDNSVFKMDYCLLTVPDDGGIGAEYILETGIFDYPSFQATVIPINGMSDGYFLSYMDSAGPYENTIKSLDIDLPPVTTLDSMGTDYPLPYSEVELEGTVTDIGGSTVTTVGFCWNTTGAPTISGSKTAEAVSIGSAPTSFSASATDILGYTTYYFRSYATNDAGTSYSEAQTVRTRCTLGLLGECVDREEDYFEPVPENGSRYVGNGWKCEETDDGTSFIYLSAAQMLTTRSARVYSYRVTYSGTFVGTEVIDYQDFNAGQEAGNNTVVRVHEHSSYGGGDPLYAVVSSPEWGGTAGHPYMSTFSVTNTGTISVAYDTQSVAYTSNHGYYGSDAWYIDEGYVGTIQSRWTGPIGGGWDDCSVVAQVIDVLVDGTINGAVDGLTVMSSYEWNPEYFVRPKLFKITGDQPTTPNSNEGGYGRWGVNAIYGVAPNSVTWGTFFVEDTGGVPDLQDAKYVSAIAGINGANINTSFYTPQRISDDYWAFMHLDNLWTIEITQGGTVSSTPYDVIDWTDAWTPENNRLLYVGGNRYISLSAIVNNSTIRIAGFDINSPDLSLDMVVQDDSVTGMINYPRGPLSVMIDGTNNIYHFVGMNGASPPVITGNSFVIYVPATVDTTGHSNVTFSSAIGYGEILHAGWTVPTVAGICWSGTNPYPTTSDSHTTTIGTYPVGSTWSGGMSSLSVATSYYYRAYAISADGTAYGPSGVLTTSTCVECPIVYTLGVVDAGTSSASMVGQISSAGGSTLIERGFYYNTAGSPTASDSTIGTVFALSVGVYYEEVTGLTPNTLYYFRAFATNSYGTDIGNELTFNTVPNYTDNTIYLNFEPWNLIPPSSPGTITDVSGYGNDASYILADMIDGVTVYVTNALAGGGGFYPAQGDIEVPNKWIVPPQSGMTQQGDASNLPLYEIFEEVGNDIGMEPALLYIMMMFGVAMGIGFLIYLIVGSLLMALLVMVVLMTGFMSTGVLPLWVLIFFIAFAIGLVYVSRQV